MAERSDHDLLVEITVKLDQALAQGGDHETRLRKLEVRVIWAAGFAAALGMGGGFGLDRLLGQ